MNPDAGDFQPRTYFVAGAEYWESEDSPGYVWLEAHSDVQRFAIRVASLFRAERLHAFTARRVHVASVRIGTVENLMVPFEAMKMSGRRVHLGMTTPDLELSVGVRSYEGRRVPLRLWMEGWELK